MHCSYLICNDLVSFFEAGHGQVPIYSNLCLDHLALIDKFLILIKPHEPQRCQVTHFMKNHKQHTNDSSDEVNVCRVFFQSQGLSSLPGDVVRGLHESLHLKPVRKSRLMRPQPQNISCPLLTTLLTT